MYHTLRRPYILAPGKGPSITSSRTGINRERALVRSLRESGYVALRAPASLGAVDVLAVKGGEILLCEVKANARSAFAGFRPADREALLDAAERAGGSAFLVWWPPRSEPVWIPPEDWP